MVRDELPANHQGRARMPIPQNWIIFLWSSLSPLIACGEGVGCGVLVPSLMTICCKLLVRKKETRGRKGTLIESFRQSERRDLNPIPPLPQSGALPSCATSRKCELEILDFWRGDDSKCANLKLIKSLS